MVYEIKEKNRQKFEKALAGKPNWVKYHIPSLLSTDTKICKKGRHRKRLLENEAFRVRRQSSSGCISGRISRHQPVCLHVPEELIRNFGQDFSGEMDPGLAGIHSVLGREVSERNELVKNKNRGA